MKLTATNRTQNAANLMITEAGPRSWFEFAGGARTFKILNSTWP